MSVPVFPMHRPPRRPLDGREALAGVSSRADDGDGEDYHAGAACCGSDLDPGRRDYDGEDYHAGMQCCGRDLDPGQRSSGRDAEYRLQAARGHRARALSSSYAVALQGGRRPVWCFRGTTFPPAAGLAGWPRTPPGQAQA
jgi:hypothetical protein